MGLISSTVFLMMGTVRNKSMLLLSTKDLDRNRSIDLHLHNAQKQSRSFRSFNPSSRYIKLQNPRSSQIHHLLITQNPNSHATESELPDMITNPQGLAHPKEHRQKHRQRQRESDVWDAGEKGSDIHSSRQLRPHRLPCLVLMHTSISLSVALSCSSTAAGCSFFSFFCLIVKSKEYPKQQRSASPPAAALLLILLLPLPLLMPGLLLLLLSFFLFFFFFPLFMFRFLFFSLLLFGGLVVKRQNLLGIACNRRSAKFRELERKRGRQTWNKARQDTGEEGREGDPASAGL